MALPPLSGEGDLSVAQRLALLSRAERDEYLSGLTPEQLDGLQNDWRFWSRPSQYIDPTDLSWAMGMVMGGRGWGKSRVLTEWARGKARAMPGSRGAFVARTAADVRDVLVDGASGIQAVCPPSEQPLYEPSKRRLTFPNKTTVTLYSSETPDSLRGPQFDWAICVHEDSLVTTSRGVIPVRDVRAGDLVLGSAGMTTVRASRSTGQRRALRLTLSTGHTLIGTPDHRVWTARGWVELQDLTLTDKVAVCRTQLQYPPRQHGRSGTASGGTAVARMGTTEIVKALSFTALSGKKQKATSLMAPRSITSTTTERTTGAQILRRAISAIIELSMLQEGPMRHGWNSRQLRYAARTPSACGPADQLSLFAARSATQSSLLEACERSTALPLVETSRIASAYGQARSPRVDERLSSSVSGAASSSPAQQSVPDFALPRARRSRIAANALGTPLDHASGAGQSSHLDGPTHGTAPLSVETARVSAIDELSGTYPVWDLTTDSHDFFADGVLVHNCDEIATWETTPDASGLTALDNIRIATRLGERPQILMATTPKRTATIKKLLAEIEANPGEMWIRRGRTADNLGNLSSAYLNTIVALYDGTALATQELEGQMLDDVEGALWTSDELDEFRLGSLPPLDELLRPFVIIAVDPSVAENPRDECGIVVIVGTGHRRYADRHIYVMEDRSLLAPPSAWAKVVAETARKWGAVVVAEYNQGAALIKNALENVDPAIRVHGVHSRVNKALRAEPVTLASDQGRLHMVGWHPALEDQLTTWLPETSKKSPDRLDAMVIGALAVITDESKSIAQQAMRITSDPARRAAYAQLASSRQRVTARDVNGNPYATLPPHMQRSVRALFPGSRS